MGYLFNICVLMLQKEFPIHATDHLSTKGSTSVTAIDCNTGVVVFNVYSTATDTPSCKLLIWWQSQIPVLLK